MNRNFSVFKMLFCTFLFFTSFPLFAQPAQLPFISKTIRQAYRNGTRSTDGRPGPAYWQNHAAYRIRVRLLPATGTIKGQETITYYNESPDSLDRLVIRLYQDYLKRGNVRDFAADPADLHDGVKIRKLVVNDRAYALNDSALSRKGTNLIVRLRDKIPPQGKTNIGVNWEFPLPHHSSGRFGALDSSAFFVAYWYPQIAVYDDIDGWDTYNFHGIQEFYNDFNRYDVTITVPRGFVVWATGRLQNPQQVLAPACLARYQKAFSDTTLIHVITADDLKTGKVTTRPAENHWHFRADNINDFAFAASNRYLWDITALPAAGQADGRILISAAYAPQAKFLNGAAKLQKQTIRYFEKEMPGVPFPFPSFTLFQYKNGMEFPMMNSQGVLENFAYHVFVATHELAHTYFPLLVGINERKYAWMDEGWAMLLPLKLQARLLGNMGILFMLKQRLYTPFIGSSFDLPPMVPSIVFGPDCFDAYHYNVYARPMMAYDLLMEMVGRERFLTALQEYIRHWRGKHPTPYDFFFTFDQTLGENFAWFWQPWFFELAYPDLALEKVQSQNGQTVVTVANKGGLPLPIRLNVTYADGSVKVMQRSVRVWRDGRRAVDIPLPASAAVLKIELGAPSVPDAYPGNNTWQNQTPPQ